MAESILAGPDYWLRVESLTLSRLLASLGRYCPWPGSESESAGPTQAPMVSPARRSELAEASPVARLRAESESCEAIRLLGPGTESERVRRRDHQLDYRAVSADSPGQTIGNELASPPAGRDYWRDY